MNVLGHGPIRKMLTQLETPVQYALPMGEASVPMNPLIGRQIQLRYAGEIRCVACGRKTRKSFNQGHCFPCLRKLASCDTCIIKPELCHYDEGTCREPSWGERFCLIPHTVYLANTGAAKVGITRKGNEAVRWVDQGATQALAIRTVSNRLESGRVEVALKEFVADKTNWRKMLSGVPASIDLHAVRNDILVRHAAGDDSALGGVEPVTAALTEISYPVVTYPEKVRSLNLDKTDTVGGELTGIKGQYLILDSGVINMRKYGGYVLELSAS